MRRWWLIGVFAALFIAVGIVFEFTRAHRDSDVPAHTTWAAPTHFYYNGYIYVDKGKGFTDSLPEYAVLLGEINNVGNTFTGEDFDGNENGLIYMDFSNGFYAYLAPEKWDETLCGERKYVILTRDDKPLNN